MQRYSLPKVGFSICAAVICFAKGSDEGPSASKPSDIVVPCCGIQAPKATDTKGRYFKGLLPLSKIPEPDVKLQLVCAGSQCPGDPPYPLVINEPFAVKASSRSGGVTIWLKPGPAPTQSTTTGRLTAIPTEEGKVVIEASPTGSTALTSRVRLTLEVKKYRHFACAGLVPSAQTLRLTASDVVNLLGSPAPFTLVAQGKETLAVYSTRYSTTSKDKALLADLKKSIETLTSKTPEELGITPATSQFKVEFTVPHASSLGDLAAKISSLNFSSFSVQDVGSDKVRVTSAATPGCDDWALFLSDLRHVIWGLHPEPFSTKLFYLNAPEVSTALNAANSAQSSGSASTPAGGSGATQTSAGSSSSPSAASGASPSGSQTASGSSSTITVSAPVGNATSVVTVPASSSASASSSPTGTGSGSGTPGSSTSSGASGPSASTPKQSASIAPLGADLLVFGDTNPGDDALITERRRILAAVDLPRPEMIISAWILQNSSTDGKAVGNFNDIVQSTVAHNNEVLQDGVLNAWRYLKRQMSDPKNYFQSDFYSYLVDRYVGNLPAGAGAFGAEEFLQNRSSARLPESAHPNAPERFQFCANDRYCLGYSEVFNPLQPRLTDLLLTVIAARYPVNEAYQASCRIENPVPAAMANCSDTGAPYGSDDTKLQNDLKDKLDLHKNANTLRIQTCETQDLDALVRHSSTAHPAGIRLNCFRATAAQWLDDGSVDRVIDGEHTKDSAQPTPVGLLRAALADFLFNYKMSQQYPHEFAPYELGRSADVLNSALRPLIDAFNRDVRTFQRYLGAELEVEVDEFNKEHKTKIWFKNKPTFMNNGLVTVRTISGQESKVDAISQSFLDASTLPQVSDLAKSILGAGQGSGGNSSGSGGSTGSQKGSASESASSGGGGAGSIVPGARILENLSPNQAQLILGALSAYQSSKVQIGRELSLDVTPRSLNGAVSAEISVTLNAGETAPPNYWGGTQAGNPADISRVATHNTSTRVRVDSIKIFDVSAFTAVVQRSRSRFPLLPPLVEIPYIGTVIGVPLPPATEYHTSTALVSAIVVPTAADLASELIYKEDQVVDASDTGTCVWPGEPNRDKQPPCFMRRAISLKDLDNQPIREFHRAMLGCFAMGIGCDYTFANVLHTNQY